MSSSGLKQRNMMMKSLKLLMILVSTIIGQISIYLCKMPQVFHNNDARSQYPKMFYMLSFSSTISIRWMQKIKHRYPLGHPVTNTTSIPVRKLNKSVFLMAKVWKHFEYEWVQDLFKQIILKID